MYDVTTVNVRGCLLLPVVCCALSKVNRLFTSDVCLKKVFNLTIDRNSEILLHFWSIGLHRIDVNNICKLPSTSKSLCDTMSVVALPLNDLCLTCVSRNLLITFIWRNWLILEKTHRPTVLLVQSEMICSTGKQPLWGRKTLPTLEVSSSLIFTSQPTIHLNHQKYTLQHEFIIAT